MKVRVLFRYMVSGLASLGNISGKQTAPRTVQVTTNPKGGRTFIRNDEEALWEDWRAVGSDIEEAVRRYEDEKEGHYLEENAQEST